jgi:lipopolysaccharide transport system permease protein
MMALYRYPPDWKIAFLPVFVTLAFVAALGPSLILASLNVKFRDFRFIMPFVVQFGLYVSPVGFASSVIPDKWRMLYSLNPAVGVIDGFRWALLSGDAPISWPSLGLSSLISAILLWFGVRTFRATEKSFADLI